MKVVMFLLDTSGGMAHYVSQLANALSSSENIVVSAPIVVDESNFDKRIGILELRLGNPVRMASTMEPEVETIQRSMD